MSPFADTHIRAARHLGGARLLLVMAFPVPLMVRIVDVHTLGDGTIEVEVEVDRPIGIGGRLLFHPDDRLVCG